MMTRLSCGLAVLLISTAVFSLDITTPQGSLEALRRMQCTTRDGDPVVYWWLGDVFSRVSGEPDRKLFRVEGMNIRTCVSVSNPERGPGFRMLTREVLLYEDPVTGKVLDSWENPWTGKTNKVLHVANDPVNQGPFYATVPGGRPLVYPFMVSGAEWWLNSTIPLFYTNPLGGDYQPYIGGTYHATEMFNFFGRADELTADDLTTIPVSVGWARLSGWLPWMEMGDREGLMYFHTAGRKLDSYEQLSEVMKAEIAKNYPEYNKPPPLDDKRPNETSWTYFKKQVEGVKAGAAAGH